MTTLPMDDPLVCQHCAQARHVDCLEPRCECSCRTSPHMPTSSRAFGLLRMLRRVGGAL